MRVQARLRLMDVVRLHLAPYPVFKLKHSFPLWRTGLCLHAGYVQTLNSRTFANLGKRGASAQAPFSCHAVLPSGGSKS